MYYLKKEFNISCSHRLHDPKLSDEENEKLFGKCNNFPSHGHNYKIILKLKSEELGNDGMIVNFYKLKEVFKEYIDDVYDHKYLNDCPGFEKLVPTAENMCKVFYNVLRPRIFTLYGIEIYETDGASAEYRRV
jgi:6-pyruvoyltetrahydropterin/6-carboxytetrahydropterin synthase